MGLIADIGRGPVALDTVVFIYFIEEHPRFLPVVAPVFSAVASARLPAITSGVTLLETLVIPYRSAIPRSPRGTRPCSRRAGAYDSLISTVGCFGAPLTSAHSSPSGRRTRCSSPRR